MQDLKVEYETRIVAFLDILGMKEEVLNKMDCDEINELYDTVEKIINKKNDSNKALTELLSNEIPIEYLPFTELELSFISDAFVISAKFIEGNYLEEEFWNNKMRVFFTQITLLQAEIFWDYGILLRGGIAIGELYHKSNRVFGPALVEAYELESKHANFPRILISKTIEGMKSFTMDYFVKKDKDDYYYLTLFNKKRSDVKFDEKDTKLVEAMPGKRFSYQDIKHLNPFQIYEIFKKRLDSIVKSMEGKKLNTAQEDRKKLNKIIEKYNWLIEKYNEGLECQKINLNSIDKIKEL